MGAISVAHESVRIAQQRILVAVEGRLNHSGT